MSIITRACQTFRNAACVAAFGMAAIIAAPVHAQQIKTIDPSTVIDGDLIESPGDQPVYANEQSLDNAASAVQQQVDSVQEGADASIAAEGVAVQDIVTQDGGAQDPADQGTATWNIPSDTGAGVAPAWSNPETVDSTANSNTGLQSDTYQEDDLIGAAEGAFGKGAEGVAKMIRGLLKGQGEPNGYIVGREAGGAFIVGARYGSGTLFHKVEGEQKVYWTGPSVGFDAGANAGNTFVLVYNLYDTNDLFKRFPAGEGQAYLVGGLHASYLRRGDIVLIPIRVGAGLRLGVNAGYLRFSKKQRWLPF